MLTLDTERLESARIKKGLSKSKLAQLVGIHPSSYLRILKGETQNAPTLKRIADALGLSMEEIFIEEEQAAKTA